MDGFSRTIQNVIPKHPEIYRMYPGAKNNTITIKLFNKNSVGKSGHNYETFMNEVGDIHYFFGFVHNNIAYDFWIKTASSRNGDGIRNSLYFDEEEGAGQRSFRYEERRVSDVKAYREANPNAKYDTFEHVLIKPR